MQQGLNVITGASGLLGGYIAELLADRREPIRAVVRRSSETRFLESLGVEIAAGELTDPAFVQQAVRGAEVVYHCAAKIGNWGTWKDFHTATVVTTRNVVKACHDNNASRLLHVSSVACYGHPSVQYGEITEAQSLGQNLWLWDYYNRSKIEAEGLVADLKSQATIVRPTWIYGPRDTAIVPRIIRTIRRGGYWMIGAGTNSLNMGYATDIAEGCVLAAHHPAGAGQAYNLCGEGSITQRELIDLLCEALRRPPIRRRLPRRVLHWLALAFELWGRAIRQEKSPFITRHGLSVFARPARFSSAKAQKELGWVPKVAPREGIAKSIAWIRQSEEGSKAAGGVLPDSGPTR